MFRVRWAKSALDELARRWTQADSSLRRDITAAVHLLEQRLRQDPTRLGESRSKGRRIVIASPLAVHFRVDARDRTVSVLQLRLFRTRGR